MLSKSLALPDLWPTRCPANGPGTVLCQHRHLGLVLGVCVMDAMTALEVELEPSTDPVSGMDSTEVLEQPGIELRGRTVNMCLPRWQSSSKPLQRIALMSPAAGQRCFTLMPMIGRSMSRETCTSRHVRRLELGVHSRILSSARVFLMYPVSWPAIRCRARRQRRWKAWNSELHSTISVLSPILTDYRPSVAKWCRIRIVRNAWRCYGCGRKPFAASCRMIQEEFMACIIMAVQIMISMPSLVCR